MIFFFKFSRYAYRDNMTDVIIQHLVTEQKGKYNLINAFWLRQVFKRVGSQLTTHCLPSDSSITKLYIR